MRAKPTNSFGGCSDSVETAIVVGIPVANPHPPSLPAGSPLCPVGTRCRRGALSLHRAVREIVSPSVVWRGIWSVERACLWFREGDGGKARNGRPPLVGRIAPVVEGRLSGRPRIERTAR